MSGRGETGLGRLRSTINARMEEMSFRSGAAVLTGLPVAAGVAITLAVVPGAPRRLVVCHGAGHAGGISDAGRRLSATCPGGRGDDPASLRLLGGRRADLAVPASHPYQPGLPRGSRSA